MKLFYPRLDLQFILQQWKMLQSPTEQFIFMLLKYSCPDFRVSKLMLFRIDGGRHYHSCTD